MPDKEIIQAVLDAVGVTRGHREKDCGRTHDEDSEAPENVCTSLLQLRDYQQRACEDWEFCNTHCPSGLGPGR